MNNKSYKIKRIIVIIISNCYETPHFLLIDKSFILMNMTHSFTSWTILIDFLYRLLLSFSLKIFQVYF